MDYRLTISESLQELMQNKGLNNKDLSVKIGVDDSIIGDTINLKSVPKIETIIKICKYFNCSIDFLLGRTDTYKPFSDKERLEFKEIINKLKDLNKTNISRISKAIGVNTSLVYRWINNEISPSTTSLIKLADHFGCSVDFLVGLEH